MQDKHRPISLRLIPKKKCEKCPATKDLTLHHKKLRSEGGGNNKRNIQVLCRDCHDKVHGIKKRQRPSGKYQPGTPRHKRKKK